MLHTTVVSICIEAVLRKQEMALLGFIVFVPVKILKSQPLYLEKYNNGYES